MPRNRGNDSVFMTTEEMKEKIEKTFADGRWRDYIYHAVILILAFILVYFFESPLDAAWLHSEFLYWPFRIIHFNNERIAWKVCHLEIALLFVSLYIVLHDIIQPNSSLRIVSLDLVITVQIFIKRELEKYSDERDIVTGDKALSRKFIRSNNSFLEYFFGFKTGTTKETENRLFK